MRAIATLLAALAISLIGAVPPAIARPTASQVPEPDLSCGGDVHRRVIDLWEHELRPYFSGQIANGLNKEGDVYVLYYTQEELQPFVEMTRRCKNSPQIDELATTLNPAFQALRPLPNAPAIRGWVCTGGHTCTQANQLLGKEVQLCSAQFLGLLGAVATDIIEIIPESQRTAAEKAFLENTATAIATQLDHWLTSSYFRQVVARSRMTPADVKDGQSKYFFQDRDLWFMTSLSDLAELYQAGIKPNDAGMQALKSLQTKRTQISSMFNLFLTRTMLVTTPKGPRAEIDHGYWRNYADSRYAAYGAATSPVLCHKNTHGIMQKTFRIESKASYIDSNLGWDFSHARRLVPALNTLARNRANLADVFGYRNSAFDPVKLQHAFANQIANKIWNKNKQYPLFSNFWDGSNGWYRAGYENGTGKCRVGQAPYSLSQSFPTGGYPEWAVFNSTIRALAVQLYKLSNSTAPTDMAFVSKNYPELEKPKASNTSNIKDHNIRELAFLSSMIGI